jgi:hypothetical protein
MEQLATNPVAAVIIVIIVVLIYAVALIKLSQSAMELVTGKYWAAAIVICALFSIISIGGGYGIFHLIYYLGTA